jgi:ribosome recycling factor
MSYDAELADLKAKLEKALAQQQHEYRGIRTGRATTAIVDNVRVTAYGSEMPLSSVANVSVPEATTILIKPWDKAMVKFIEKAITEANIGLTPMSDGAVIRLTLPPLSGDRRKQLAAQAKDVCEKTKVALRNVRRDGIKSIETKGKAAKLPEDLTKKTVEKVGDMLKDFEAKAEKALKEKTDEILTV